MASSTCWGSVKRAVWKSGALESSMRSSLAGGGSGVVFGGGRGQTALVPAAPAAIQREHVQVAHLLQVVGGERAAKAAAAIEEDGRVLLGNRVLDVALEDAAADVVG